MIERMHDLTILVLRTGHLEFLERLQSFGMVHVTTGEFADSEGLVEIAEERQRLEKCRQALLPYRNAEAGEPPEFDAADDFVRAATDELAALAQLSTEREQLRKAIDVLAPWGSFDQSVIDALRKERVDFNFYSLPKAKFMKIDFGDRHVEVISQGKQVKFVIINRTGDEIEDLDLQEEIMPAADAAATGCRLEEVEARVKDREAALSIFASRLDLIDGRLHVLNDTFSYQLTGLSLEPAVDGEVLQLKGYIPHSNVDQLAEFLEDKDAVYLLEEPEEPADTPVKLKNRRFAKLFEPITNLYGLPSYAEIELTPMFAPFFALFFGLCLADIGYGIIVSLFAAVLFLVTKKPSVKPFAALGFIFGITTILGGVILDNEFGHKVTSIEQLPDSLKGFVLFPDVDSAMFLAIALGVIQVLFGYVLRMINAARNGGFAATLQPLGTFLLIMGAVIAGVGSAGTDFAIGPIAVGKALDSLGNAPLIGAVIAIAGVVLIFLFNNLQRKLFLRPLFGLWEMYGIVTGIPGDILSYIRLFALGLSGALLGGAINFIALMVRGDSVGVLGIVRAALMVLVLFGGHAINFAIAALGAFVHPLRLTFVEFYKAVGFAGGGKPFKPFMRTATTNGGNK
jgi:V/A-type H+/Na+-transporting ATPase subunit I